MKSHAKHQISEDPDDSGQFSAKEVEQSIPRRFENQVLLHGNRIAVKAQSHIVTYLQLDDLSNRIATTITSISNAHLSCIAIIVGHDIFAPAAILSVLKTGNIFVCLDPSAPEDRNAFILNDSRAPVLLSDGKFHKAALAIADLCTQKINVINLECVNELARLPTKRAPEKNDPAIVVYTSGSTGNPKGVCHSHRNLLHDTMTYTNLVRLCPQDRLSLLHPLSSVASTTALFGALLNGATLYPLDIRQVSFDELDLWLNEQEITCFHTVPTLFRRFMQHLSGKRNFPKLRLMRLGGESVTKTDWQLCYKNLQEFCQIQVGLSSTETLDVRQGLFSQKEEPQELVLPLGNSLPDMESYLIDGTGAPTKTGETGEIVVRSDFLFLGYWSNGQITTSNLPVDSNGRRIFHTGDLGRITKNGQFFHVGRSDFQVKIAGNRVEIAEAEQALHSVIGHSAVVVMPRHSSSGETRLVAFIECRDSLNPTQANLQKQLRTHLPGYMIPSQLIFIEKIPLLAGGKVDRLALINELRVNRAKPSQLVRPRNTVEQHLVKIWQQALGVEFIGIHDDFFSDLSGDSLAAVQIAVGIDKVFQHELSLDALYEHRTIAQLALIIPATHDRLLGRWHLWELSRRIGLKSFWNFFARPKTRRPNNSKSTPAKPALSLNPDGTRLPLFAICGLFGHALRLMFVGRMLSPEQPFYGLQPPNMDWCSVKCTTLGEMAKHYLQIIRTIQPHGPYQLLGTSFGGIMVFEIALQLQKCGEKVVLLAMVDTDPPTCMINGSMDRRRRREGIENIPTTNRVVSAGERVATSHDQALNLYTLREQIEGPIVYFKCEEISNPLQRDRRHLWSNFSKHGLQVVSVAGPHGSFHREPQLSMLVAGLNKFLICPENIKLKCELT